MALAINGKGGLLTGIKDLDRELGGGIHSGSLILIEGQRETGKSVLSQHIVYSALATGENAVAYYTTDSDAKGMITRTNSLSMPVLHYFLADRLRVFSLNPNKEAGTEQSLYHPLVIHLARLPERFNVVVIDSLTSFITHSPPMSTLNFFWACKKLCEQGRSVILVADSHAFDQKVLARLASLCEYHFQLRPETLAFREDQVGGLLVKLLEVAKLHGAECRAKARIYFEIKTKAGIQTIPYAQFQV